MLLVYEKKVINMIKIDVISGFLGAGKTTLIQKLFKEGFDNEKIVLIENEFGEIGIDGGFLKESGVNIKEINSGCICCSLVGDFSKSLKEVIETYNPDRIIIEPSGVGKLSDIKKAILKMNDDIEINILTTVVDGSKAKLYIKNFGEFFNDQVKEASTVVLTRVDKINEEKLHEAIKMIKNINKYATIITTDINLLDGKILLKTLELDESVADKFINEVEEEHHHEHHHEHNEEHHHEHGEGCTCGCCGHHHHHHEHHHADEIFSSWGKETHKAYSYDELNDILLELANDENILRSKGIVKAIDNDKWYYFDLVNDEYEIRLGNVDVVGRVCVIGSSIDQTVVEELFN